jgi:DNA end-binding protein Ku
MALPRALWSGSIQFGLVNVPVRLYPAISEHALHFHLVHRPYGGAIGYQKLCKKEEKPVPDDEIVKVFAISKGEYVELEDEDFERARAGGSRTIDITDFVPYQDIDPILFAKSYYLGPSEGGEHVYSLLLRAMEKSGLAAVAKFVMRERQHLGALRPYEGILVLEQLHFADEQRPPADVRPSKQRVSDQELDMATTLIESYTGPWKPEKYEDTYRDELLAAIKEKRGKKRPSEPEQPAEEEPLDLLEALRQSVAAAKKPPRRPDPARRQPRSRAKRKPTRSR